VGVRLRTAYKDSQRPGASTMLSSVASATGKVRVFVLFDGEPAPVPGFRMITSNGNIATGVLDLQALPTLASSANVRYISGERVLYTTDDPGVVSVRAPRTRTRLGVTGKGVMLGIVDTGIDWTHPDFLDSEGKTRIAAILDMSDDPDSLGPGDLGEAGPYGGIAVYREDINEALNGNGNIRQKDYVGHGTHVAGTAAASPSGDTLNSLGGVAPGASIVAIKVSRTPRDSSLNDLNIFWGVAFLDSLAWFNGMPAVANLSLGSPLGSRDGTSLFEQDLQQFINDPSKASRPGRSMVVSSGNSRIDREHASGDFAAEQRDGTALEFNVTGGPDAHGYVQLLIWYSPLWRNKVEEIEIFSPDGVLRGSIEEGDSLEEVTDAGLIIGENARNGVHPLTGDKLIYLYLSESGSTSVATGTWRLMIHADEGVWDAYVYAGNELGARFVSHVSETGTVNEPGTAEGVITVGAYNARTGWWSLDGGAGSLGASQGPVTSSGELTFFTSLGPTRDGRMKPEITAPGRWVMSSMSSHAWPLTESLSMFSLSPFIPSLLRVATDSIHAVSQGTSFSAPHVAGVAALLLEADSTLTSDEIRELITSTATVDSQTTGAPDNFWGYGRANAAGAVAKALGFQSMPVQLSATLNPPDTLKTDSLRYSVSADFGGSLNSLANFRLRVTWPPDRLSLRSVPDTLAAEGGLRLATELDSSGLGILNFQASAIGYAPDLYNLVSLDLKPVNSHDADSVFVGFEVLSLNGDLAGEDLTQQLGVLQAGPLSVRLEDMCLVTGDLDGNGSLDIFDILEMLKVISGQLEETTCSDMDGSGRTDIFDLLVQLGELKK
jgi:subtilisin family serine protease